MKLIVVILIMLIPSCFTGQENDTSKGLLVGQRIPEFVLKDIRYSPLTQLSTANSPGKWLILDFWNKYCSVCVASFPKINKLQQKYAGSAQFILIGYTGSQYQGKSDEKSIKQVYEKFRIKQHLDLAIAFDSTLFAQFGIGGCPYIIVINPEGIIKAITYKLEDKDLSEMMRGEPSSAPILLTPKQRMAQPAIYDDNKPFLVDNNGGPDSSFIFRSLLAVWNSSLPRIYPFTITSFSDKNNFIAMGVDSHVLYRYAYTGYSMIDFRNPLYGFFSPEPLKRSLHSAAAPKKYDDQQFYTYSMNIPPGFATTEKMKKIMQNDLANYFGFRARIENRLMPCYELRAFPGAKKRLASKGGKTSVIAEHTGISMHNSTIYELLAFINGYYETQSPLPFIDRTGIHGNIDLELDTIMTDFEAVKKSLRQSGLYLVKTEKIMKVIVLITD